jgi:hypothetical protein
MQMYSSIWTGGSEAAQGGRHNSATFRVHWSGAPWIRAAGSRTLRGRAPRLRDAQSPRLLPQPACKRRTGIPASLQRANLPQADIGKAT